MIPQRCRQNNLTDITERLSPIATGHWLTSSVPPSPRPSGARVIGSGQTRPFAVVVVMLGLMLFTLSVASGFAAERAPLKVLLVASGGYHDYKKLAPFLSTNLSQLVNATLDVKFGLDVFADPRFADAYDAVVYDVCDDETP